MGRAADIHDDPRLQALFAEPPERFVAARDALARALSAERHPGAQAVRALRRPTVAVATMNRVARAHPDEVAGLLEAGAAVREAHRAALGGRGRGLRAADEEVSRRLDRLVAAAAKLGADGGRPVTHSLLVQVRSALRAVAVGQGGDAERLRAGTLETVRSPTADDALDEALRASAAVVASSREGARPRRPGAARAPGRGTAPGRTAPAGSSEPLPRPRRDAAGERAAARELRAARRAAEAAEREVRRREAARARAAAEVARLSRSAERARAALDAAERASREAVRSHERARERLAAAGRGAGAPRADVRRPP